MNEMKTAIVYYSKHHGNTKKVVKAIRDKYPETMLLDAEKVTGFDLEKYDLIGVASGIYAAKFHKSVIDFINRNLPENKDVFVIHTYGFYTDFYTKGIKQVLESKNAHIKGIFGCFGYDTFGPLRLIGGIKNNHPDDKDLVDVVRFYESML